MATTPTISAQGVSCTHHTYLMANKTAGYSGFVIYQPRNLGAGEWQEATFWMVPGTYHDDWDNQ